MGHHIAIRKEHTNVKHPPSVQMAQHLHICILQIVQFKLKILAAQGIAIVHLLCL